MVVTAGGRELLASSRQRPEMQLNIPQCPGLLPQPTIIWPLISIVPRLRDCHLEAGFGLIREARLNKVQVAFFYLSSVAPTFPSGALFDSERMKALFPLVDGLPPPKQASFNDH